MVSFPLVNSIHLLSGSVFFQAQCLAYPGAANKKTALAILGFLKTNHIKSYNSFKMTVKLPETDQNVLESSSVSSQARYHHWSHIAIAFSTRSTAGKTREEVRSWPAYVATLLRRFDPEISIDRKPKAGTDASERCCSGGLGVGGWVWGFFKKNNGGTPKSSLGSC